MVHGHQRCLCSTSNRARPDASRDQYPPANPAYCYTSAGTARRAPANRWTGRQFTNSRRKLAHACKPDFWPRSLGHLTPLIPKQEGASGSPPIHFLTNASPKKWSGESQHTDYLTYLFYAQLRATNKKAIWTLCPSPFQLKENSLSFKYERIKYYSFIFGATLQNIMILIYLIFCDETNTIFAL